EDVGPGATAEVERLAGGSGLPAFDELLELRRRCTRIPGRDAEPIHGAEEDAHRSLENSSPGVPRTTLAAHSRGGHGAGDRPRTCYLNLGQAALYQASYTRSREYRFQISTTASACRPASPPTH